MSDEDGDPEKYKKFRYKLLSIKNWLVISFVVLTFYIVMKGKVEFIPFITATDCIVLAAYFAVNYGQDKLKEDSGFGEKSKK